MTAGAIPAPRAGLRIIPEWDVPWYALAPLLLIPVVGGSPANLNNILFAVEVLLLVAGIKRPVWIPAALIVSEVTASNYIHDFGFALSNRLLLSVLAFLVVMPHLTRAVDVGKRARVTIGLAATFVLLTTIVDMALITRTEMLEFLRFIATGVFVMVLIPITIRDRDDVLDIGKVLMVVAMASAITAVFQHYSGSRGTPLWEVVPHAGTGGDFASWETRALGLSENPIHVGNVLMIVGLFALGVVLIAPLEPYIKRITMLSIFIMTAASYFTFTRSWAISVGVALIVLCAFYRGKYWREFLIVVVLGASVFWYWSDTSGSRYTQTAATDDSAAARPVLWELSINMAEDHPWLGVGYNQFMRLSPEYSSAIPHDILERQNAADVIGKYEPHNDFLNVWVSWGFLALLLYVALITTVGLNFIHVYRNAADPVIRGLGMGGLAALIAYVTNSMFHNFFEGSLAFWIIAGFSLVLPRVDRPPMVNEPLLPRLMRGTKEIEWKVESWVRS
jgi:hypothetical protein